MYSALGNATSFDRFFDRLYINCLDKRGRINLMKDAVTRLNDEYGFKLTDKEIDTVVQQAEEAALLFRPLFEVDLTGITPLTKVDKKAIKTTSAKKGIK